MNDQTLSWVLKVILSGPIQDGPHTRAVLAQAAERLAA